MVGIFDATEIVVKHLLTLLNPRVPIIVVHDESVFSPYWVALVSHVHDVLSNAVLPDSELVMKVISKLYTVPPVACSPSSVDVFVYVENPSSVEDIFFGVNTAGAVARDGYYPFVVPVIARTVAKSLLQSGFNPPLLEHTLFYFPYIASISATNVVIAYEHVQYTLSVTVKKYVESGDLSYALLGYLIARAVKERNDSLKQAVQTLLNVFAKAIGSYGFSSKVEVVRSIFKNVALDVIVVYIKG